MPNDNGGSDHQEPDPKSADLPARISEAQAAGGLNNDLYSSNFTWEIIPNLAAHDESIPISPRLSTRTPWMALLKDWQLLGR